MRDIHGRDVSTPMVCKMRRAFRWGLESEWSCSARSRGSRRAKTVSVPAASLEVDQASTSSLALKIPIMSLLHRSIGSRLIVSGASRFPRRSPLVQNRSYADSTPTASPDQAPGPKLGESEMVSKEGPSEGLVRHQPDYQVATDYRTS